MQAKQFLTDRALIRAMANTLLQSGVDVDLTNSVRVANALVKAGYDFDDIVACGHAARQMAFIRKENENRRKVVPDQA